MRSGICSIQQALTAEAASTVKQAVGLARRRGHAQVTPLHVASAMFASSTGLLKRACLQCHSHPLQCKALELCFNVSLNRLPASTSSPLLGPTHHSSHHPSLSNALVAAFKRAQAHQRRGSIENQQQQQPILALKIEIEQLIVSILDDPSVSRVMREAGFSSTQVKNKVEQAVSLDTTTCSTTPQISTNPLLLGANVSHKSTPFGQFGMMSSTLVQKPILDDGDDDVMSVLESLARKRRNTVIVGESNLEGVVIRGVMDRFERGEVPGDLRYVQLITLPLFSLRNLSKDEVEHKLVELRCLVKSYVSRGVVLYIGDLKWVSEFWSSYGEQRRSYYCPVEHIVMELRRMACGGEAGIRMCLLGFATFQTYMRCKTGHPSLEAIWELSSLTLPVGSLSLSLNLDSGSQSQFRSKVVKEGSNWALPQAGADEKHLTCCTDCSVKFDREAQSLTSSVHKSKKAISSTSSLPSWLQQYKEESTRNTSNDEECVSVMDLCKKWNSFCSSSHKHLAASQSPTSSSSISSREHDLNLHKTHLNWPFLVEPKSSPKEHHFWIPETSNLDHSYESNLKMFMPEINETKPELLSNPNSSPNSASSSEVMEDTEDLHNKFKEFNAENLRILCSALEAKVPCQKDAILEIANAILQSRSGMSKIMNTKQRSDKEETWLLFLGADKSQAKEKIAREIAKVVFGSSQSNFVPISLRSYEEVKNKRRRRDEEGYCSSYVERFGEVVNENPRRVFFLEDLDQIDHNSQKGIKKAIESGSIALSGGETVPLKDGIVIFSCESFGNSVPRKVQKCDDHHENELDLNIAVEEEYSVGEIGIPESVDKEITFKIQEL